MIGVMVYMISWTLMAVYPLAIGAGGGSGIRNSGETVKHLLKIVAFVDQFGSGPWKCQRNRKWSVQ